MLFFDGSAFLDSRDKSGLHNKEGLVRRSRVLLLFVVFMFGVIGSIELSLAASCGDRAQPLLTVADFDGNGIVDMADVGLLNNAVRDGKYLAIFDRNVDGRLDNSDFGLTANDLGKSSTRLDRELATLVQSVAGLQGTGGSNALRKLGYFPSMQPTRGYGVHWLTLEGRGSLQGFRSADPHKPEGLVVSTAERGPFALFWGAGGAHPLFLDPSAPSGLSHLDYPERGGVWESKRVQKLATTAPSFFSSPAERWYPYGGVCVVGKEDIRGRRFELHQHTSFAECQALPSDFQSGIADHNAWVNFWMMHAWVFVLNPNGVFAATHPCLDGTAPSISAMNGGRPVPAFFQQGQ